MAGGTTKAIGSLAELENAAKQAADQFSKASSDNAIWDKATKSLSAGLAGLNKTTSDAKAAADDADKWRKGVAQNYNNDVSNRVRDLRREEDASIDALKQAAAAKEEALSQAKRELATATEARGAAAAKFDAAQKDLLNLPKAIGDQQKLVATLRTEVKDADAKHLLVETVVKLEDLDQAIQKLREMLADDYRANLWGALNDTAADLIAKSDALPSAQKKVPDADAALTAAKKARDDAQAGRLESIKAELAKAPPAPPARPASPPPAPPPAEPERKANPGHDHEEELPDDEE